MPDKENDQSTGKKGLRHLRTENPISYPTDVDRWAVVVGISKYKHEGMNLRYADRDAEELYRLLLTPEGGGFEEDHVKKLINEEATTSEITKSLRSFLKRPSRDDIVLLYFACHGTPDPYRPSIVYLLTHDTDPRDISGTALPMREIDLSLKDNLLAERVVIIADTCHSAAIGGAIGRRGAINDAQTINLYLQEVSEAKGGVALLTSAEANETSQEDEQWDGGHGVFTYFLLKGMKGEADGYGQAKDGIVTVGELFEYVRENVKNATNNLQHPAIGTNRFDRNLPMAITGDMNAHDRDKSRSSMPDYVIRGSIKDRSGHSITSVKVQAMDADQQWFEDRNDDILGNVWVKPDGTFEIPFDSKQFQESWLEGNPDIYLLVRNTAGEIIYQTEIRRMVEPSDTENLTFDIVLDSLEKRIEPPGDPYSQSNSRLLSAFARLADVVEIRTNTERTLKLLTSAVNAWSLYTREKAWKSIGYDGPQVPKYPWKQKHSHKLDWEKP